MRQAERIEPVDVLIECLRASPSGERPLLDRFLADESDRFGLLADAARFHRVFPYLERAVRPAAVAVPGFAASLAAEQRQSSGFHLGVLMDLENVATALDTLGVDWAVLKGPVLAGHYYERPDLRPYQDLDILVDAREFGEVLRALEAAGASVVDRNWPMMRDMQRGEVSVALPFGTPMDLHWHLFLDPAVRRQFPGTDVSAMLRRRRLVTVNRVQIPTLDPIDTALYVATHAALSGGNRLVWMGDLAKVIAAEGGTLRGIGERGSESGLGPPFNIMCRRTADVLGSETLAIDALSDPGGASAWERSIAMIDRLRAPHMAHGHLMTGQLLVRATRSSTKSSMAALGDSLWSDLLLPLFGDRDHPWRRRNRTGSGSAERPKNPLHVATGGATAREAFVAWVEGHGPSGVRSRVTY